jgi:hypothetical protein
VRLVIVALMSFFSIQRFSVLISELFLKWYSTEATKATEATVATVATVAAEEEE